MTLISTFCSSRWVAKLWRNVCGDTRLAIPAARAAAETARQSCRADIGLTGSSPGNSQLPWVRDLPPIAQQLQQLRREHDKAILLPLALLDAEQHALVVDVGDLQRDDLGHA